MVNGENWDEINRVSNARYWVRKLLGVNDLQIKKTLILKFEYALKNGLLVILIIIVFCVDSGESFKVFPAPLLYNRLPCIVKQEFTAKFSKQWDVLNSVKSDLTSPMVFKNDKSLKLWMEILIFGSLMLDLATFNTHVEFREQLCGKRQIHLYFPKYKNRRKKNSCSILSDFFFRS